MSENTRADFTFVIPNTRWHREGEGRYWNHIPYPEGLLTAVLRKNGYTVNHVDANTNNLTEDELYQILREKVGKVVGISALSVEYRDAVHKTFEIINTKYIEKKIVLCLETTSGFNLNQEMTCEINWTRRFKIMQVHTCLHLLCSIIKAPVTGGQINEGKGRLDFDLESKPDKEFVIDNINKLIKGNFDVKVSSITEEELDKIVLKKINENSL